MDASKMTEADAALLRARLHIRGGRRRFRQSNLSAGLAALYDALGFAMRWYILSPEHQKILGINDSQGLKNERDIFSILSRADVLGPLSDFDRLESLVEQSLDDPSITFDSILVLEQIEIMMTQLNVIPFDENALPPEDPTTL